MTHTHPTIGGNATRATTPRTRCGTIWIVVLAWAAGMAPLAFWGLPTSATDDLLFGGRPPWPPDRYGATERARQRAARPAGADTDLNPLLNTERITNLTPDDDARAEILLRYRLYSRQPDEMITFMALQRMNPRALDFDPRLYQYGGGYIYLIGAVLGLSSLLGVTHLTSDVGVYLADPAQFARFYVVARFVSLVFGALTLVAVYRLARLAAGRTAGWIALICAVCAPVFFTAVLEAKPHLPSVCGMLWASLMALQYCTHARRRDALRLGLASGCALGLVLTGAAAAVLWPALLIARRAHRRAVLRDLLLAGVLALGVYVVTNPFIPYNLLFHRESLASNVANSTAMYAVGRWGAGALRVGQLLVESVGGPVLLLGLAGYVVLLRRRWRATLVASAPGVALLLLCVAIGAGKPAEFARFLLLPSVLLCVATAALLAGLWRVRALGGLVGTIVVIAAMRTPCYIRSFALDARGENESRRLAARFISEHADAGDTLGVLQVPAPYAVPPLDFAGRRVLWLPGAHPPEFAPGALPDWLVFTADDESVHRDDWWRAYYCPRAQFYSQSRQLSRIAWANKPVFVFARVGAGPR